MSEFLVVRDGLIPEQVIDDALASVPPPDDEVWRRGSESGGGPHKVGRSGPTFYKLPQNHPSMEYMNARVLDLLTLDPSAAIDSSYAGLFQMLPDSELSPHRDRNTVPRKPNMRRRVGVVLFLNDPDGGHFQLWTEQGPMHDIQPMRNRIVLFEANCYHAVTKVESRRLTLGLHLASSVRESDPEPWIRMTWLADDHPEVFNPE